MTSQTGRILSIIPICCHDEGLDHFIAQRPSYDIQTYGDKKTWGEGEGGNGLWPLLLTWLAIRSLVSLSVQGDPSKLGLGCSCSWLAATI